MSHLLRRVIDSPWTELPPRRIGLVPTRVGTPDRFVLIGSDDAPRMRIDLYFPNDSLFALDVRELDTAVVVGFGSEIAIVSLADAPVRTQRLGSYFIRYCDGDDYLLAVSGTDVTRIDSDGTVAWQSAWLALDGIVIERIDGGVIYGSAEMDPPGGWRSFAIAVEDGREIVRPE